jgi:hypothetical protein
MMCLLTVERLNAKADRRTQLSERVASYDPGHRRDGAN